MEYGIGLDTTLGISYEQDLYISKYASELGYTSIWTPESSAYDSFVVCLERSHNRDGNLLNYLLMAVLQLELPSLR